MAFLRIRPKQKTVAKATTTAYTAAQLKLPSRSIYSLGERLDETSRAVLHDARVVARWRYQHHK